MPTYLGGRNGDAEDRRDTRLRLYANPLRLAVSASLWRGGWYLAC
jgi:hypothetical protein